MRAIGMLSLAAMLVMASPAWAFGPPQHGPSPEQMFRRADTDRDGQVTFEEFKAAAIKMTRERFNHLDRNQDGVLSQADHPRGGPRGQWDHGRGQRGGPPQAAPGAHRSGGQGAKSGKRAAPSAKAPGGKRGFASPPPQPGEPVAQGAPRLMALARKADQNQDHQVTFDELQSVAPGITQERFRRLDRNQDGVLTGADMSQGGGRELVREGKGYVLERLKQADTDGDHQVSREEAKAAFPNMPERAFDRLDRNGDGVISKADRNR